jgi:CRP/FNR family transcriptional regulator, cyclic AMP receptor protein
LAMRRDSKIDHLSRVRLFSALNKKELGLISRVSDEVQVPGGKVLCREGEMGHEFFLIMDGEAQVESGGHEVAMLGPGQYFGELSLLTRAPRNASVTAKTDMEVLVLGQREFSAILEEVPALSHKLLGVMAERLREADSQATSN